MNCEAAIRTNIYALGEHPIGAAQALRVFEEQMEPTTS
jgi:hypothetical protein